MDASTHASAMTYTFFMEALDGLDPTDLIGTPVRLYGKDGRWVLDIDANRAMRTAMEG